MPRPTRNLEGVLQAIRYAMSSPRSNDMRVAQLIDNALQEHYKHEYDLFYQEDEDIIKALNAWVWKGVQ